MLALFLVGWAAVGGTCSEAKLTEGWAAFHRVLQTTVQLQEERAWVEYYRTNQSYPMNASGPYGPGRINYAPVFVSPTLQWAVPNQCLSGPPSLGSGYQGYPGYGGPPP